MMRKRSKLSTAAENSPAKRVKEDMEDSMCWVCHTTGCLVCCDHCPRVYHLECLGRASKSHDKTPWMCPVCQELKSAGDWQSVQDLPELLLSAVKLMHIEGCESFERPVDLSLQPTYKESIFNPMDLQQLEQNIKNGMYKCPQQLEHDAQWILHNCIIYNGIEGTLTDNAKVMIRVCKREVSEIALCPDCYRMSVKKPTNWFTKPCAKLHKPVWAKLKGYPFWPAKVLNLTGDKYDVLFFGDHNRAKLLKTSIQNVSNIPSSPANSGWVSACREMESYISNLKEVKYADIDLEIFPGQKKRNSEQGCIPVRVDRIGVDKENSNPRHKNKKSKAKPSRHVMTDSLSPGKQSKQSKRVLTKQNGQAKGINSSEFLKNSIITATPLANVNCVAVDSENVAKRLQSDAHSSLRSGQETENGWNASFMGKEQTYVASADGVAFTFVAAVQECRKIREESLNVRPVASVGVKNPTSHVHQNMLRRRQHDDQNPDIQRENVTTEIDRSMFSVEREVENMKMALHQNIELHYKEKLTVVLAEQRQQLEEEKRRAVEETKKKHWCANCWEEAGFYCCLNTSYCSLDCQQQHWPSHVQFCQKSSGFETGSGVTHNQWTLRPTDY